MSEEDRVIATHLSSLVGRLRYLRSITQHEHRKSAKWYEADALDFVISCFAEDRGDLVQLAEEWAIERERRAAR